MENLRTVEILRAGIWYNSDFEDIEKDNIFRLFESTGDLVIDSKGIFEFIATNNAYLFEENNIWEVEYVGLEYERSEDIGIYEDI